MLISTTLHRMLSLCVALLTSAVLSFAAVPGGEATEAALRETRVSICFPVNSSYIDSDYRDNARSIAQVRAFVDRVATDSTINILKVSVWGYASPEGPVRLNRRLARERMEALRDLVLEKASPLCHIPVSLYCGVVDLPAFADTIASSDIAGRATALDILADSLRDADPSLTITRLKGVDNGRLWDELRPLLNKLRHATVIFEYEQAIVGTPTAVEPPAIEIPEPAVPAEEPVRQDTVASVTEKTVPVPVAEAPGPTAVTAERKPLYVSLKSNMLYDALLIPSIGAEVYLGRMYSVSAEWSYAWWSSDRRHDYWRYYGGDIEVRRWFGRLAADKPLTGHHIGLYAQIFTYDFELGGKGEMGNKFNYGGGVEYGFSLPVGRRINIDFTVGVGYIGGKYHEYVPIDGHYVWQATKRRNWFGPAKAEVSFVWLIGYGNTNRKKGGDR